MKIYASVPYSRQRLDSNFAVEMISTRWMRLTLRTSYRALRKEYGAQASRYAIYDLLTTDGHRVLSRKGEQCEAL